MGTRNILRSWAHLEEEEKMNLLRFLLRGGSALALVLSGISVAHATVISSSTITAFSATTPGSGPYVGHETINSSFTSGVAKVSTSSVTCPVGGGGCSGDAVDFSLTLAATASTPTWVTMDGTLSGTTNATGQLVNLMVDGIAYTPAPGAFTINSGSFYDALITGVNVPQFPGWRDDYRFSRSEPCGWADVDPPEQLRHHHQHRSCPADQYS